MRVRRCWTLWLEPREAVHFQLDQLFSGGTGLASRMQWYAHAPQLDVPVEVDVEDVALLGHVSASEWSQFASLSERHGAGRVRRLLSAGLLVGSTKRWRAQRDMDDRYRNQHWHGMASVWHAASRWSGIDAAGETRDAGLLTAGGLREAFGAPPPVSSMRGDGQEGVPLERVEHTRFDRLLDARATCRNFDIEKPLPIAQLAQVLERVFGARGRAHAADDFDLLKKTSPSGGGLHPTECYLISRNVDGLPRGLYHYQPCEHVLQPLSLDPCAVLSDAERHLQSADADALDYLAWIAVGGQQWFADAHVLCVLVPHFRRSYWKYRNHAKAYRVCILDVGHLSQTLQLSAVEQGLGSFITAAINEVDIERALGLNHWEDGPLAVCGLGIRAEKMVEIEFDPNRKVWPHD